jgi:hypothetical protein
MYCSSAFCIFFLHVRANLLSQAGSKVSEVHLKMWLHTAHAMNMLSIKYWNNLRMQQSSF